jgi:hypothetical protein
MKAIVRTIAGSAIPVVQLKAETLLDEVALNAIVNRTGGTAGTLPDTDYHIIGKIVNGNSFDSIFIGVDSIPDIDNPGQYIDNDYWGTNYTD